LFILEKINDNIFKDLEDEYMYYLEIPREISWSLFKKITSSVVNNIDNSNFDAARAYIYFEGITDFVRIYTRNPSLKRLEDIRDKYNTEIKKYI
jgi:mannose/fructose/N-acetylgalactosamine-specific phosphotransferase system component IIB